MRAVCWTNRGGTAQSHVHIGDEETATTLCGIERIRGLYGVDWLPMLGRPVHPDTVASLAEGVCPVSCARCWEEYQARRLG